MALEKSFSAAEAFSAFARKFAKSTQASGNKKPAIFHEDQLLQKKVNSADETFRLTVISSYKKYLNPFKTLGKNSAQAKSIAKDQEDLLKAYALFKTVAEANRTTGDAETYIKIDGIQSPLCQKDCYTAGGEFLYMQCWLIFEQGIKDYIPELVEQTVNMQSSYRLTFSPLKTYRFDYQDKEVMAIIEQCYHS